MAHLCIERKYNILTQDKRKLLQTLLGLGAMIIHLWRYVEIFHRHWIFMIETNISTINSLKQHQNILMAVITDCGTIDTLNAMLRYAMLCYAELCHAMPCPIPYHTILMKIQLHIRGMVLTWDIFCEYRLNLYLRNSLSLCFMKMQLHTLRGCF